jgi:hypothetical protein
MSSEKQCFSTNVCSEIVHDIISLCGCHVNEHHTSHHKRRHHKNTPTTRRRTVLFDETHTVKSYLDKLFPTEEYHYSQPAHCLKKQNITFVGGTTKPGLRSSTRS